MSVRVYLMAEDETTETPKPKENETPTDPPKPDESDKVDKTISPLDQADAHLKERKEIVEREEKLQDRKEKFLAEEKVGGRAKAGTPQTPEEQKEAAHQERVNKIGNAVGAEWAKPKSN